MLRPPKQQKQHVQFYETGETLYILLLSGKNGCSQFNWCRTYIHAQTIYFREKFWQYDSIDHLPYRSRIKTTPVGGFRSQLLKDPDQDRDVYRIEWKREQIRSSAAL